MSDNNADSFVFLLRTMEEEDNFRKKELAKIEAIFNEYRNDTERKGANSLVDNQGLQQIKIIEIVYHLLKSDRSEELLKVLAKNFPEQFFNSVFD